MERAAAWVTTTAVTRFDRCTGSPVEIADRLLEFEAAGAAHVQLVVDPITRDSIEWLADVIGASGSRRPHTLTGSVIAVAVSAGVDVTRTGCRTRL